MTDKAFIAKKGLVSLDDAQITGSLNVSQSFTAIKGNFSINQNSVFSSVPITASVLLGTASLSQNSTQFDGRNVNQFAQCAMTTFPSNSLYSLDSRTLDYLPSDRNSGFYVDFKSNSTDGLSDGGSYHGVITFRAYGVTSDMSGGSVHQLGFTQNGHIFNRTSSAASTWGNWKKLMDMEDTASLPLGTGSLVNIATTSANTSYQIPLVLTNGSSQQLYIDGGSNLVWNPSTNILSTGGGTVSTSTLTTTTANITTLGTGITGSNAKFTGEIKGNNYFGHIRRVTARNPFFDNFIYIPEIHNILYQADKKYLLTISGSSGYSIVASNLFDGEWETIGLNVPAENSASVRIDFNGRGESGASGYLYNTGFIFVTTYFTNGVGSITADVFTNSGANRVSCGTPENVATNPASGEIWKFTLPGGNNVTGLEINVQGKASGSANTYINQIEYCSTRPYGMQFAFCDKYGAQKVYNDWTWKTNVNSSSIVLSSATGNGSFTGNLTVTSKIQGGNIGAGGDPGTNKMYVNGSTYLNGTVQLANSEVDTSEGSTGKTFYGWFKVTIDGGVGTKYIRLYNND